MCGGNYIPDHYVGDRDPDIFLSVVAVFSDFILFAEDSQEFIQVGFISVFDTEIIYHQRESKVLGH
jgi:hypothetical protein